MSKRYFANFALEEFEEGAEAPAQAELLESTAEVAEQHDEVMEHTEDVAELQMAAEEGIEGAGELQEVGTVIAEEVAEGEGLTEVAAEMAAITINRVYRNLGLKRGSMPAMENFKSKRPALEASKLALENAIIDGIKKVWEKVKSIVMAVAEKIKNFFVNLFKSYDGLVKHLEKVQAAATKSGDAAATGELDKPAIAKVVGADLASAEKAITLVGHFSDTAASILTSIKAMSGKVEGEAAADVGASVGVAFTDAFKKAGVEAKKEGDTEMFMLPGHEAFKVTMKDGVASAEFTAAAGEAPKKLKALSAKEVAELMGKAIVEAKKGKDLKKVADASGAATKELTAHADKMIKLVSKLAEDKDGKDYKKAAAVANSMSGIVSKVSAKLPSLHYSVLRFVGEYGSESLKALKKPEAAAAPAKKEGDKEAAAA